MLALADSFRRPQSGRKENPLPQTRPRRSWWSRHWSTTGCGKRVPGAEVPGVHRCRRSGSAGSSGYGRTGAAELNGARVPLTAEPQPAGHRPRGPGITDHLPGLIQTDDRSHVSTLHDPDSRGFASDNYAGAHPEILAAHRARPTADTRSPTARTSYTERLQEVMADHFGPDVEVFPVFNGTGANVLSLQSMLPRWGAVICSGDRAHPHRRERRARARRRDSSCSPCRPPTASSPRN